MIPIENAKEFEMIELEIGDVDKDFMITQFVDENLQEAAVYRFYEVLRDTANIQEALYQAIINETVLNVLIEQLTSDKPRVFMTDIEFENSLNIIRRLDY